MATFNGKNYSIEVIENQFVLVHPVSENETFDSFDELVESHPICEESRKFFFEANKTDYTVIEIQVDGVWAGSGKLRGDSENGWQIVDCGAQFCDDNDESEEVYGCIEDAIECGDDAVDFRGQRITWTITVPV